jgi:Protein of unknown function (DUF1214)
MTYITPVPPGFWSLTASDAVTSYTAPNPIDRYALGSDDDLQRNVTLRSYPSASQLVEALNDPGTFQGPPPIVPST